MSDSDQGFLALPSELLHEIIKTCSPRERCQLRATCKTLKEHADPIVFRRLHLYLKSTRPDVTEHQIIALATRSCQAYELTRYMMIKPMRDRLRASEQSQGHFGACDDLRVHLPSAISALRNLTYFRWHIDTEPSWLVNKLLQATARLPRLTELVVKTSMSCRVQVPLHLFSNLSTLSVKSDSLETGLFHQSQIPIVIANSPQLRCLHVVYSGLSYPLPTLRDLFAMLSGNNPLCLEQLRVSNIDATVDEVMLPHLMRLSSLRFEISEEHFSVAQSVWDSLLANNIKLFDVFVGGIITSETISYLSSFSGLRRLTVQSAGDINLEKRFFAEVLPKHADSLQELKIDIYPWKFDPATAESVMKCLNLRDLCVRVDQRMPVQRLLDTVAQLPELKTFRFFGAPVFLDLMADHPEIENFKPIQGLRYVENLAMNGTPYVLVGDVDRPVRYQRVRRRAFW